MSEDSKQKDLEKLEKIFYDPKHGFIDAKTLYKKANEQELFSLTQADITRWYRLQNVNQVFKRPKMVKKFEHIQSLFKQVGQIQADLMILLKYGKYNKGYKYILTVVDIYSRKAWALPLKSKLPPEVAKALQNVLAQIDKKYSSNFHTLTTDGGSEFKGSVKRLLSEYNYGYYSTFPGDHNHMGIIERFNGTLGSKLKKYMEHKESFNWVDGLDDLISNYNHTVHRTINQKPENVYLGSQKPSRVKGKKIGASHISAAHIFQVGDLVKYQKVFNTFDKRGSVKTYSTENHKIVKINLNASKYKLDNGRWYYPEHLQSTDGSHQRDEMDSLHEKVRKEQSHIRNMRQEFGEKDLLKVTKNILPKASTRTRAKNTRIFNADFV